MGLFYFTLAAWGLVVLTLPLNLLGGHPPIGFLFLMPAVFATFVLSPMGGVLGAVGTALPGNDDATVLNRVYRGILCNCLVVVAVIVIAALGIWFGGR